MHPSPLLSVSSIPQFYQLICSRSDSPHEYEHMLYMIEDKIRTKERNHDHSNWNPMLQISCAKVLAP